MISQKLMQVVGRSFTMSAKRNVDQLHPGYSKLRAKQALFQKDNGIPVYLKGGGFDGILYRGTYFLAVASCVICIWKYYDEILRKK